MSLPRVAITVGDPAGIGPEIVARACADSRVTDVCDPVVYGPADLSRFRPGALSADAGRAAYDAIVAAVRDAQAGRVQAVATAPVNKEAFALAGLAWRGHTDLLAHLTGAASVAMMFYAEDIRVVLATIHVPLAEVPRLLTRHVLEDVIRLTAREMPRFGFAHPRLAVAGLNPHAGEHGVLGIGRAGRVRTRTRRVPIRWHRRHRDRCRPTRCSCAPPAATSTSSSRATTTRA